MTPEDFLVSSTGDRDVLILRCPVCFTEVRSTNYPPLWDLLRDAKNHIVEKHDS